MWMLSAGRISNLEITALEMLQCLLTRSNLALQRSGYHTPLMNIWWCEGPSRKLKIGLEKNVVLDPWSHSQRHHSQSELGRSGPLNAASPGGLVTSQVSGHTGWRVGFRPKNVHFWHAPRGWRRWPADPALSSADISQWISDWFQQ